MAAERATIEKFLSDDLIVRLGALQMILDWADHRPDQDGTASLLPLVKQELAGMTDRATGALETLRLESVDPVKEPQVFEAAAPSEIPDHAKPIDLDGYGAPKRDVDLKQPPSWLTDLDDVGADTPTPAFQASANNGITRKRPVPLEREDLGKSIDNLLAATSRVSQTANLKA